ncbi:MAG: chromosome segregation protein SMC [Oscillospiraceae bacterium]|nr:chromosome segregation protein SMC [Oscillospiraceae bacterium]
MYLKQLELQGFKSFPDKTVISFGHDITAIVGPNGSGKSNISDAIRWVMGEQNSRSLRGQRMEDVIFGGTEKRSQVGFAEATLVLDNSDRALRFDADELMITRRYYRSGESEFYINKQSVRLRDVNELFMDTGLGREGYSNISQGRIDEILSLKSTDRREIFEEAAGISKYRHRKEETERRLANTEENLLRIGDKISELELQVEPLREQAEKAQKYLTYRDELKGVEVALWQRSLEKLSATARKAEEDYHSAAFILEQQKTELDQMNVTVETLRFDLHNRDMQTDQLRDQIARSDSLAQEIRSEIAVLRTNSDNCSTNMERIRSEMAEQESRSGGIGEQITALETRITEIAASAEELAGKLHEAEAEGKKLADSAEGMTKRYLTQRNEQERLRTEHSAKSADLAAAEDSLNRSAEHKAQVTADCRAAMERREGAEENLSQVRKTLAAANEEITAAKNTIEGYRLRSTTRMERRDSLQKQVTDASVALDTVISRLKLFEEMEREYEGYSKAVRVVMHESKKGTLSNIHGPVSSLIRTDDAYTVAVEIALGSALQQIVVGDEQAAKNAINYLTRNDAGRATFLPLNVIQGKELNERGVESCNGFVGIASELVRCDAKYRNIICNLLGKTVIADDMDAAIAIAKRFSHRFRIVTLDGQVINAGGSMTGGSVSRNAGILSRANEIERLRKKKADAEETLTRLKSELAEAVRLAQQVEFELATEEGKLRTAQDEALRLTGEEKQYAVLAQAIGEAISGSERELAAIAAQEKADEQRKTSLTELIAALERQIAETERELTVLSDGQSIAAEQSNRLSEKMTAIRMDIAALEAERATAVDSIGRLRGLEQSMRGDHAQKQALLETYRKENDAILAQIAQREEDYRLQSAEVEGLRDQLKTALDERMQVEARKTATEREVQEKNRDINNMERESARLETKKTAAEMEEKQIIDRLWESYGLTPSTASEAAAEIESVTAAQKTAADLKRKITALGTPNLGAIDEFARVNERYEYLTGQRDDVLTSKRDLLGIISDITTQMTEIFTTEFAKINTYFGQTFTEMFGGGKASLELEEPEEPLTCGIEIRVQPPGKQLKTITLLSGGEKAFVAIALYFAILRVRPTPFCMLDEIDAALDDRNVERFASYLRGFSSDTQFIVITHRRGTMEAADMLYGVTMQEQGISKILHLDLNQMEQQLDIISEE